MLTQNLAADIYILLFMKKIKQRSKQASVLKEYWNIQNNL